MTINVAIFGVGALGCLFGAQLSPHANVTLIGHWPAQLEALASAPLQLVHPDGHSEHVALRATAHPDDVLARTGPVDLALILTKAPGTARAVADAARILRPDGLALTLQNGLGHDARLAAAAGADRTTLGITTLGAANRGATGVCFWAGMGTTVIATRPAIEQRCQAIAALFEQAGLSVSLASDVTGLVWGKLAVNAAINPLTALLRVPNGQLTRSEWARDLLRQTAREVASVASAQGITLPFEDAAAHVEQVANATAANHSSMLQDVLRGVPTEISVINGAVVQAAEPHGIPVPVNALLLTLVRALENSYSVQVSSSV